MSRITQGLRWVGVILVAQGGYMALIMSHRMETLGEMFAAVFVGLVAMLIGVAALFAADRREARHKAEEA